MNDDMRPDGAVSPEPARRREDEQWREEFPYPWREDDLVTRRDTLRFLVGGTGALFLATGVLAIIGNLPSGPGVQSVLVARVDELGENDWKVFDFPVVLAQFVHTRHQHRLHPWARWQIADDSQDTRRQKERARAAHQEAQRIAARHQIILAPGVRKLFAPLLIFSSACWMIW